ncbi:hypothetical protein BBJ28_00005910 [Nothophytophthora sp. Chile5]|nr:hypothetical protein BBJ28_00005910 [Nothophytophthora sp. Chile5]
MCSVSGGWVPEKGFQAVDAGKENKQRDEKAERSCDYTIRSTLDKISTDLRDSTNFLARDMGVNIHVKCPGCFVVCYVPPATACLRCGSCHTYFASPSVGEVTNFHMTRLASSISSSFMGFFGGKRGGQAESARAEEAREAPIGRLIAAGQNVVRSPRHSSTISEASELSASFQLDDSEVSGDEMEEKPDVKQVQDNAGELQSHEKRSEPEERQQEQGGEDEKSLFAQSESQGLLARQTPMQDSLSTEHLTYNSPSSGKATPLPARAMPLRSALPAPSQNLIKVEGDIVEL